MENKTTWDEFLSKLKGRHKITREVEKRAKAAGIQLEIMRKEAGSYLELLGTNTFTDEKDGFKVWLRKYKKVEITDKKAFMAWLKANCSPDEIIEFLCPPTTSSDLKKFVEKKYEESKDINFSIDGVDAETSHIIIKTKFPSEEE